MCLESEYLMVFKLLLATVLGSVIGYEREIKARPAGLRTHMLVSMGSALFTMLSLIAFPGADTARVASYVVMGIGFIGAGTVLHVKSKVFGLTTAASLWVTAAIGMSVAVEYYFLAIASTIFAFIVLSIKDVAKKTIRKRR